MPFCPISSKKYMEKICSFHPTASPAVSFTESESARVIIK